MHAYLRIACCAMVGLVLAGSASGTIVLSSDTTAIPGWHGSVLFTNVDPIYFPQLAVSVDYAVYDKAQFLLNFPGGGPIDSNAKFVYAYQIFNNLDPHPGWPAWQDSEDYVSKFSVGMSLLFDEQASNPGFVSGTGQAPTSSNLLVGSAGWTYRASSNKLAYHATSAVLYYASPFGPEWNDGTVQGINAITLPLTLPSPMPEPASLCLLALGATISSIIRRKKK
jgi:hypothetical protein